MNRILFVDDEPHLINGLKRMLRTLRKDWDMAFALSGFEALTILDIQKYDVIVSDMRMPGMDGADLLEKVKQKHPNTVRIILSGQSEKEMILKAVKPAHQFLSKPCDAELLIKTIKKALKLRDLVNNESIKELVSQIDSLPSSPMLFNEIIDKINAPDVTPADIANIIRKDISMTAAVLKIVNSSFFGFYNKIASPEQAVSLLGLNTMKSLILSIKLFSQMESDLENKNTIDELWKHSYNVGLFAKSICSMISENKQLHEDAFTIGLLHDIGMITLSTKLADDYQVVHDFALKNNVEISRAEYEILGTSHSEIGGYLLGLWGFPDKVINSVAKHHVTDFGDKKLDDLTFATQVADIFAQKLSNNNQGLPIEQPSELVLNDQRYIDNSEEWLLKCSEIYGENNG